jgi:outer membrane receptor protein involved in Fe transport
MTSYFPRRVATRARGWLWPAAAFTLISPQAAAAAAGADANNPIMIAGLAPQDVEQVFVWGLREDAIGLARSSSEGRVNFTELRDRPLLRPGELAEVIPGLAVTQHSGTGKANQYFLRGFNLDHGTDFSVSFDGVPINLPSHGHGQGYLDLNAITPEFVEIISFRKGPYFADVGDFSSAGTAAMETFTTSPRSFAEFTAGKDNFYRVLGMAQMGDASYIGGELAFADGPWVNPENLERINVLGRIALGGNWSLTALAYSSQWDSTDQIPLRAIDEGLIPRLGTIDPTDGGETSRTIVALRNRDMNGWDAVAYVQRYELNLWSNFTYFLDDPVNGDQFEQADKRWIFGGSVAKTWDNLGAWTVSTGAQLRGDEIYSVGLYNTVARERINTVRQDKVSEWAGAVWADAERAFGPVRAVFGLRADAISVDVESDNPLNSGDATDALVSPKLSLAWRVSEGFELYANAGRGFHSNDARGATATVSPKTGDPANPVNLLSPSTGAEVGFRWEAGRVTTTATAFYLHLDSELVYVGDAGETEATNASERFGGEVLFTWRPIDRIDIDLSAAATHARLLDAPGADRIPNALEYVFTGGISALLTDELIATLTFRLLGPAPLTEDGLIKSETAFTTNLLLRYQLGRFTFTGQVLNLLNNADNDIQYFYTSRLPGEPDEGIHDFHIHPMEPRTWRLGVRITL